MKEFASIGFVEILSLGISGFAFLLLLFAYALASQVQQRILEVKLDSMDREKLDVWSKLAERQLVNTRYFMACAFAFVLAGICGLKYQSEAHVTLSFTPSEAALKPTVRKNSDKINISDGAVTLTVKSDQTITIENTALFDEIRNLQATLNVARLTQHSLSEHTANLSPHAGFGSLKVAPK